MRLKTCFVLLALPLMSILLAGCPTEEDIDPNPTARVVEYPVKYRTGENPTGVAADDINGDSVPDLCTVNTAANSVSVLLSLPDGGYDEQKEYAVDASPRWLSLVDVSGDGVPDLLTANLEGNTVSILFGAGDGTFSAALPLPLRDGAGPIVVAAADLTGDANVDIATANSGDGTVAIAPGVGGGVFGDFSYVGVGSVPRWLSTVDVDGDGPPELIAASRDSGDVAIVAYVGGAFGVMDRLSAGTAPRAIVPADYNEDGHPDLAITATGSREMRVFLGDGVGGFDPETVLSFDFVPSKMTGGDFDDDGHADLAVLLYTSEETPSPLGVAAVFQGDGTGDFGSPAYVGVGERSQDIMAADMDEDGSLDLLCNDPDADALSVTRGRGDGTFASERRYPVGRYPRTLAVGDLNGDNRPDLVIGHRDSEDILIMVNQGDGSFENGDWMTTGDDPKDIKLALLNDDGELDMAVANFASGTLSVFLGEGDGTFGVQQDYSLRESGFGHPRSLALGDLNNDGFLDAVAGHGNTDTIAVVLGNGDGTFGDATEFSFGNYPISVQLARIDADSDLDLVFVSRNDPSNPGDAGLPWLVRVLGNGDGTFDAESRLAFTISGDPLSMSMGDVNGDGRPDAVSAHSSSDVVDVMLCTSSGKFSRNTLRAGETPESVAIADMDGNGAMDLVTANKTETLSVLLNRGGMSFNTHFELAGGTDGFAITATDLNNDTNADLVVLNRFTDDVSVFMGEE